MQAQVDAEHEEQMRLLKEKKRREKEPPPPPKTITVMAGGKNKPSWPIAPGIANDNQPRVITLNSAEDEEEMYKNRFEVAQAAGLKHVDVIHGDENFYPTPMKDYGNTLQNHSNFLINNLIFRLSLVGFPQTCFQQNGKGQPSGCSR